MTHRRLVFAIIWKLVIVALGGLAVADSLGASYAPYFWGYFTNISNLAVTVYFACELVWLLRSPSSRRPPLPVVKHALTAAMALTGLVGHFMLGFRVSSNMMVNVDLLIMHYVVPVMTVLDWLVFDEKGSMRAWEPPAWSLFPLGYLLVLEALVNVYGVYMGGEYPAYGMYPYPFLQAEVLGWPTVIGICAGLLAGVVALGYAFLGIDRWLARADRARNR